MRYTLYFNLTYPKLEINNPLSRMHCIHYTSSLYGKLSDEMTGRFNQDLPENLHTAFEKTANFEPCIITKQSINERKVPDINHIDITPCQDEIEINEAHITKVRIMTLITSKTKTNKASSIILTTQEPTTKTMETKAKEITIPRATIRRNQSMYQSH